MHNVNLPKTYTRDSRPRMPRAPKALVARTGGVLVLLFLLAGCATLGPRESRKPLPPNAPSLESVLSVLAENDRQIQNFRAEGVLTLQTPDTDAKQRFRGSVVAFRRPADLYMVARARTGTLAFRMVCVGKALLFELPTEGRREFYANGDRFLGLGASKSSASVAAELFLADTWAAQKAAQVRMVSFDEASTTAVLEIGSPMRPRQRIEVAGPDWHVAKNELLRGGKTMAIITKTEYADISGVRFPGKLVIDFPGQGTHMDFAFQHTDINTKMNDEWFTIDELEQHGKR